MIKTANNTTSLLSNQYFLSFVFITRRSSRWHNSMAPPFSPATERGFSRLHNWSPFRKNNDFHNEVWYLLQEKITQARLVFLAIIVHPIKWRGPSCLFLICRTTRKTTPNHTLVSGHPLACKIWRPVYEDYYYYNITACKVLCDVLTPKQTKCGFECLYKEYNLSQLYLTTFFYCVKFTVHIWCHSSPSSITITQHCCFCRRKQCSLFHFHWRQNIA